jgi:monofunctional biosynthetic peptidoglycan transglycosylase
VATNRGGGGKSQGRGAAKGRGQGKGKSGARGPARPPQRAAGGGGFWRFVRRLAVIVLILAVVGPPLAVLVYRFAPPPITFLMVERLFQGHGMDYRWTPLARISPALQDAVVASEDERFCEHHGFDFTAMEKAMKANERRPNKLRGGSTISQQTAKNVFLWPGRSYVRKGVEAWFTVLIEAIWGKPRIMEMYLNVVEFGPGVYGAEAAAERFFHEDASQITPAQAARLAAVLPKPLAWKAAAPGPYIAKRSRHIGGAMGAVRAGGLAECLGR